jgi:hypothetical protein
VKAEGDSTLAVGDRGSISYLGAQQGEPVECVWFGTFEASASASLSSLRDALADWWLRKLQEGDAPFEGDAARMWIGVSKLNEEELSKIVVDESEFWFHPFMEVPPTNPALFYEGDRIGVRIQVWRADEPEPEQLSRLLAPYLERYEASCRIDVSAVPASEGGEGFDVVVDLDRSYPPDATAGDALKFGDEAGVLLRVSRGDAIPKAVALDLLSAGRCNLFYGQPESNWLEAKAEPYDHLIHKGKGDWRFELAKDVAALANSPEGGIIVLGMSTRDSGNGDIINGHREFDLKRVESSVYRKHVSQLIYPDVVGFEVRRIEGSEKGRGLAVLVIPPQPESSHPFLVQGLVSEQKLMGRHLLLPVRRGDDTALTDIGVIHARLRLGQQVIEGREEPS